MLVRFECPACSATHVFDMPETTIHMTCSRTAKVLELKLTTGGDVRSKVLHNGHPDSDNKTQGQRANGPER